MLFLFFQNSNFFGLLGGGGVKGQKITHKYQFQAVTSYLYIKNCRSYRQDFWHTQV